MLALYVRAYAQLSTFLLPRWPLPRQWFVTFYFTLYDGRGLGEIIGVVFY